MTFQEPNVLKNDSDVDLSLLHPYFFCDVHGENASDTAYLPVQPDFPVSNGQCSSLWRGFIATLHLRADGTLRLLCFDFPYSSTRGAAQTVDKPFAGDFAILFRPFFPGPNTIVPFRGGVIVRDSREWFIDDQTMTAHVDGVYRDAGLRVSVCGLTGFIPRSLLPKRSRTAMHGLIGSEIDCRLVEVKEAPHAYVFRPVNVEDGGR